MLIVLFCDAEGPDAEITSRAPKFHTWGIKKETLPFNRFIQRPEEFFQFLQSLTRQPEPQAA